MLKHNRNHNWRRLYDYYLAHLRSRYFTHLHRNREFYINLYNYLTYNDVD